MASTITLGNKPATFVPMTATIDLPGGGTGQVSVVFKYRPKSEYATWVDDWVAKMTNPPAAGQEELPKDGKRFMESLVAADSKNAIAQLLDALESWDAPFELNQENLAQLEDEIPGAALHLLGMYANACRYGKLGN